MTESVIMLEECLSKLKQARYRFNSFTLDGKRCLIQIPLLSFCMFHQEAIVRHYITKIRKVM